MLYQILAAIIVLASSIYAGLWLEKITRDEKFFRKNFSVIFIIVSLGLIVLSLILSLSLQEKLVLIFSLIYFDVVCFISLKR